MSIIDISKWKKFHLSDIFYIDSGTKLDKIKMHYTNPQIDFVGRSGVNNGITTVVDELPDVKAYEPGNLTLALGGEYLGSCFVQPNRFYTSQNVIVLIPKENISFNTKQFIATSIFRESQLHYKAFIDELNPHIKTDFEFMLPVNDMELPDYDYMNDYIEKRTKIVKEKYNICSQINVKRKKIEIDNWKEFKVSDIFITERKGNTLQVPTGSYVSKRGLIEGGETPRITVSGVNNGITGYYNYDETQKKKGEDYRVFNNFISVSFLGTVFYQKGDASLDMKVHCLKPIDIELDEYIALFLVSVLRIKISEMGKYADQISSTVLPQISIKLPIDSDGKPDYKYMKEYMYDRKLFNIDKFNTIKNI